MMGAGVSPKVIREVQNDEAPLDLTVRLAGYSHGVRWPKPTAQTCFQEEYDLRRKVSESHVEVRGPIRQNCLRGTDHR